AREQVADLIGSRPAEIIFTASGTESDNLAILGTLAANPDKRHILTTAVEHEAVWRLCQRLEHDDYEVTYVGVDQLGRLDEDAFAAALRDDTAIASVMHANNETGVLFPIERLAMIAAERGAPLHVDAVQTAGKLPIDVGSMPVAMLSLSSHKMHGPMGAGVLYLRRGQRIRPMFTGGHQEHDLRAGTENLVAIVGLGAAAAMASRMDEAEPGRIRALRDRLERGLLERVNFAHVNGDPRQRVFNTTNIGFETLEADAVVIALSENGICASAGAACASGSLEASHVLKAMGIPEAIAHGGVRFSLSRFTTDAEIDEAIARIPPLVSRMRKLLPHVLA
ncbi:MAG: aminotransferase class V-fold PLP-dependent enzyme, partial [Phycisphaerae bacterium]